jgi:hypothetical protein
MARRPVTALALAALCLPSYLAGCGSSGSESSPKRLPKSASPLPPEGDYSYASRGFERLSAVVSSGHRYPRTSAVTVATASCGYSERWEPRPERIAEWRFCTDGRRWRVASLFDYHEFFGQATIQRFACRGPLVPRPPFVRIGFRWVDRCRGAGSRVTVRYVAARKDVLDVGGVKVEAIMIRARARLRGRIDGHNAYDSWLSRSKGVLIRRTVRSDTKIDTPFGKVADRERYSLALRSLAPR